MAVSGPRAAAPGRGGSASGPGRDFGRPRNPSQEYAIPGPSLSLYCSLSLTPAGSRADRVTRELRLTDSEPQWQSVRPLTRSPPASRCHCHRTEWGQLPGAQARRGGPPGTFKVASGPGAQAMIDQLPLASALELPGHWNGQLVNSSWLGNLNTALSGTSLRLSRVESELVEY